MEKPKIWQQKQRQKNLWPEKKLLPQPRLSGTAALSFQLSAASNDMVIYDSSENDIRFD